MIRTVRNLTLISFCMFTAAAFADVPTDAPTDAGSATDVGTDPGDATPTTDTGTSTDTGPVMDTNPSTDTSSGCGSVTFEGCCNDNTVYFCEGGTVSSFDCSTGDGLCGWKGTVDGQEINFYDCGSDGLADPSGNNPYLCEGATCTPNCDGKTCGGDGCGNSCGTCADGQSCVAGSCEEPAAGCGDVTEFGCCDGNTLQYCLNGALTVQDCGEQSLTCGWLDDKGYYDCAETPAEDPTGAHPINCSGGTPTPTPDAGSAPDTSTSPDTSQSDMAVSSDTGTNPTPDTVSNADTGATSNDTGTTPAPPSDGGGGGCVANANAPFPAWMVVVLVGLLLSGMRQRRFES